MDADNRPPRGPAGGDCLRCQGSGWVSRAIVVRRQIATTRERCGICAGSGQAPAYSAPIRKPASVTVKKGGEE